MKRFIRFFWVFPLLALATLANAQSVPSTDSTNLKPYVGTYTFASGSPIQKYVISTDKGDLYGAADDYGKNKLIKQDKADTYKSTSSYGSIITFVRDASTKALMGLTMAIQGSELTAKKDNP